MADSSGALVVDLDGDLELTDADRVRLSHPGCAGVILFSRNYANRAQLQALTTAIKQLRARRLFICVDQEGGRVQRFRDGFTLLPSASSFGTLYDEDPKQGLAAARHCGLVMAEELRQCGVDFSFAPVLDVAQAYSEVIGDRSFHRDPGAVAALAGAWIEGMHESGMPAIGKHFPGHGGVTDDSHLCLPCDHRSLDALRECDLVPYQELCLELAGIMTAHVHYDSIHDQVPVYSHYWLHEVLREQLGFSGAVFSDDLSMQGAITAEPVVARAERALAAGCDFLVLCKDRSGVDEILSNCIAVTDNNERRDVFTERLESS